MKEHNFNNKANAKGGTDGQKLKNIETDCDMGFEILLENTKDEKPGKVSYFISPI